MNEEEIGEMVEDVREELKQADQLVEVEEKFSKLSEYERRKLADDIARDLVLLSGVDEDSNVVTVLEMQVESRFRDVVMMPSRPPISPVTVYMDMKTSWPYFGPSQYFTESEDGGENQ